ncbi:unnamed protein product [Linum trigynum]|uniref:Uncharacterized protein n=1 Tax=Linum trigynum TaxID=586398 RepID=A0AAV2D6S7_9ROSI
MAASTCVFSSCCYFLPTVRLRKSANPIARIGESEKHAGDYSFLNSRRQKTRRIRFVVGSSSGKKPDEPSSSSIPSWIYPNSDNRRRGLREKPPKNLTIVVLLVMRIGSVFEYVNQKPVFGVLDRQL